MKDLAVEYRHPDEIRPDPNNPRTHPARQLKQLQASIQAFGFANPILVDEERVTIAGHGRLLAAKALGLTRVPAIELTGLTALQKKQLRIADNKIAQGAGWDIDLLQQEIEVIAGGDLAVDWNAIGFEVGEIDKILATPKPVNEDVLPDLPAVAVTQPGDIWIMGPHRVAQGDCRAAGLLRRLLGESALVDAAFLDPPYNVRMNGFAVGRGRHREFAAASGEMTTAEFRVFLAEGLGACAQVSRDGAVHFVCMDHRHFEDLSEACAGVYAERLNVCVWNKSNAGMGSLYRSKHELVFVMKVGTATHINNVELGRHGRSRSNVWDYAGVNSFGGSRRDDLALHPTTKPVQLVADAIMDVTARGDLVLDGYLGSGATLIACERTGRRFVGCDIDPLYVDVAVLRWEALTGQHAIHSATGMTFTQRQAALSTTESRDGDQASQ